MTTPDRAKIAELKKEVRRLQLALQESAALMRKIMEFADRYEDLHIPPTPLKRQGERNRPNRKTVS